MRIILSELNAYTSNIIQVLFKCAPASDFVDMVSILPLRTLSVSSLMLSARTELLFRCEEVDFIREVFFAPRGVPNTPILSTIPNGRVGRSNSRSSSVHLRVRSS